MFGRIAGTRHAYEVESHTPGELHELISDLGVNGQVRHASLPIIRLQFATTTGVRRILRN